MQLVQDAESRHRRQRRRNARSQHLADLLRRAVLRRHLRRAAARARARHSRRRAERRRRLDHRDRAAQRRRSGRSSGISLLTRTPSLYNAAPDPFLTNFNENIPLRNLPIVDRHRARRVGDPDGDRQHRVGAAVGEPGRVRTVHHAAGDHAVRARRRDRAEPDDDARSSAPATSPSRATLFRNDLAHRGGFGVEHEPAHVPDERHAVPGAPFALRGPAADRDVLRERRCDHDRPRRRRRRSSRRRPRSFPRISPTSRRRVRVGRYGFAAPPRLDHVVIAVSDWERSNAFYRDVLGAEVLELDLGRYAYRLPDGQQLNVHGPGATPHPRAIDPVRPGNSDLCFAWDGSPDEAVEHLRSHGVEVELGPVARTRRARRRDERVLPRSRRLAARADRVRIAVEFRELLKQRRMIRHYETRADSARDARAHRRDGAARAERRVQPGPAPARRRRPGVLEQTRGARTTTRRRRRALVRERSGAHLRDDARGGLPRALSEGRQAPGRGGDRVAGSVLARRRRRRAHARAARRDRRGARRRGVRHLPGRGAQLRELLAIPADFALVAGVTLGRPLPDPEWSKLTSRSTQRRRTLDELVHWNTWTS